MSPTRFVKVNNLTFVRCKQRELIIGKKYMFIREYYFDKKREVMYGTINDNEMSITEINKITYINKEAEYKSNNTIIIDTLMSRTIFLKLFSSKTKIQQAMEQRAINLILQNIVGDKMFKY